MIIQICSMSNDPMVEGNLAPEQSRIIVLQKYLLKENHLFTFKSFVCFLIVWVGTFDAVKRILYSVKKDDLSPEF